GSVWLTIAVMLAAVLFVSTDVFSLQNASTVLDGVYTTAQATKGEAEFQDKCAKCHEGDDAGGPMLTGRAFVDRWREDNVDVLYEFIRTRMPADSRGSLSDEAYLNILTYLLESNGFAAGNAELRGDMLPRIRLVGKDGPKPLPNNTLIRAVGCL